MKKSIVVTLSKIVSLGLIFGGSLIYLITKYSGSSTTVVEVTTNSMPIAILIIITFVVIIFIAWLGSSTMAAIKDTPFGFGGILLYGSLIGSIAFLGIYWIDKVADLVDYDSTQFLNDLATYKDSVQVVLAFIVSGLVIALLGFVYEKTQ